MIRPEYIPDCIAARDYLRLGKSKARHAMGPVACFMLATLMRMRGRLCTKEHFAEAYHQAFGRRCGALVMNTWAHRINRQLTDIGAPVRVISEYGDGYRIQAPPGFDWPF